MKNNQSQPTYTLEVNDKQAIFRTMGGSLCFTWDKVEAISVANFQDLAWEALDRMNARAAELEKDGQ